jgi:acyl homoserine lactone synthase
MSRLGDPVAIGNTTAVAGSLPADRASFDTVSPPGYRSTIEHDGAGPLRSAA